MNTLDALDTARARLKAAYVAFDAARNERDEAEQALQDTWLDTFGSTSYKLGRYSEDQHAIRAQAHREATQ